MTPTKPALRGHFHQAMVFVVLGAGVPLVYNSQGFSTRVSVSVYVVCALLTFGISALYHRITWSAEARAIWRKLDHAGIYLMIAGTFTPVAMLGLSAASARNCLMTIWIVALAGIVQSIFFVKIPKIFSALIYLVAGYLIVPYMGELQQTLGALNVGLLIAGGVAYTLGALCYALKRPVLDPRYFGYHEVFHILVNAGAILHFFVINDLIFSDAMRGSLLHRIIG
jgi:hemolysin III